jgi:hypothetical protein
MTRLDEIKARHEIANSQPITDLRVWDSVSDVPALVAAVEAVLELHEEVGNEGKPGCDCGCLGLVPWCKCGDYTYPCPTVVAIRTALETLAK